MAEESPTCARKCGVFTVYSVWAIAELLAWAFALTAVVTDYWAEPTLAALPFVKSAGLWKVCYSPSPLERQGRSAAIVGIGEWWRSLEDSYHDVRDKEEGLDPGCSRRVAEFYGHIWGHDRLAWLQLVRAFSIMFIWIGFLKFLIVSRTYMFVSRGAWLASPFAVLLCFLQVACGWVAWFFYLSILHRAMENAPEFLDRGTFRNYAGWSFWTFLAAVAWTTAVSLPYLVIEDAQCCVREKEGRLGAPAAPPPLSKGKEAADVHAEY